MPTHGKVLIINDFSSPHKLGQILTAAGYEVAIAHEARCALDAITTQLPELILLDLEDGIEVLRRIQSQPNSRKIPILVHRANAKPAEHWKDSHLGIVDFINGHFRGEEVLARVAMQLELSRLRTEFTQREAILKSVNKDLQNGITQRQRAEKKKKKLLSILPVESEASLSFGIVNHLNNLLGPINLCADMLRTVEEPGTRKRLIDTIEECSKRGVEVVNQMLSIALGANVKGASLQTLN